MSKFKHRFYYIILTLCIIFAVGAYYLYSTGSFTTSEISPSAAYRTAPSFELPDSEGKKHTLDSFRGNVVVLHFWASWCPPCLEEIPQWVELGNTFKNKPVKLVA